MSQEGIVDVVGSSPVIPTNFIANVGSATPIANTIELLGAVIANAGIPFQSVGSGNTITYNIQYAASSAATGTTAPGIASFKSTDFSVDAHGFVSLQSTALGVLSVSGTTNRITSTGGQNPVIDIAATYVGQTSITTLGTIATGVWQGTIVGVTYGGTGINGSTAANGTLLIGNGTGYSLATLTAGSGITITNGAGTISIAVTAGSTVVETLTGNSGGAIPPSSGNIGTVGSGSITIVGSGNTLTTQLTGLTAHAVLVGAGSDTITKIAATANTGAVLQNNSGADPSYSTATYPSTTTVSQLLYSSAANVVSGLTTGNNGLLVTSATGVPSILAGPGTTGNVLQSNAAAAPSFSSATYPSTTTVSQLLYSSATNVVAGLATANRAVVTTNATGVPVVTALATDGQLIIGSTSGAPAAATLTAGTGITITNGSNTITIASTSASSAFDQIAIQTFTSTGTYTPTTGMKYCIIECVGGGGAGGGVTSSTGGDGGGGGGGAGGYSRKISTAAAIGASQAVTIPAAATGVSGTTGNNGGDVSVGSLCIGKGGSGGGSGNATNNGVGGAGGVAGTGDFTSVGNQGGTALSFVSTGAVFNPGGAGAGSHFGGGVGGPTGANSAVNGNNANVYGAGGSGAVNNNSASSATGGSGSKGVVIITEYLSV